MSYSENQNVSYGLRMLHAHTGAMATRGAEWAALPHDSRPDPVTCSGHGAVSPGDTAEAGSEL